MVKLDSDALRKCIHVAAVGTALQVIGGAFIAVAALSAVKEVNTQIKKALIERLSEQV